MYIFPALPGGMSDSQYRATRYLSFTMKRKWYRGLWDYWHLSQLNYEGSKVKNS